ncbi:hypothetical protein MESS2_1410004 [Mesorhizobium metallidurans STM 2683]|uniref:Uncharacterized protein n=1 Tax=Mesorhizobium metallidurans STM 2683 TaxID=1297569 RepID=M5EJE8_9HYPH|nr:hypothetical protein MESS2_1410004 [Mesorhizobium metallidurans STM 2683]
MVNQNFTAASRGTSKQANVLIELMGSNSTIKDTRTPIIRHHYREIDFYTFWHSAYRCLFV